MRAKRSNPAHKARTGLLRRCAPRNDGDQNDDLLVVFFSSFRSHDPDFPFHSRSRFTVEVAP
ncbi:hypothetical protein YH63_009240 [Afipia massiliensis]|uniref:Uncharacterized protein n=1 Tax=Afipia massiliensis TaxID=211460 RepID=A0A4U6BS51_9BRAD|nr:hypothetical protein YH63_009240 [Afipia massiliensis]